MITFRALGRYGRLGNQLFQIATTIGLATKFGHKAVFPFWEYIGKIKVATLSEAEMNQVKWIPRWEHSFTYDSFIMGQVAKNDNIALQGYFQSEKYFEHCKEEVINCIITNANIEVKEELNKKYDIKNTPTCAIHIRRGDYLSLPNHYAQLWKTSYYNDALQITQKDNVQYIIFSDDIAWCEKAFANQIPVKFSEGNTPFEDLMLMSECTHHIIANSSFSWWGSYLANAKMVIAPKNWFGSALPYDTKDLYRKDMIII